MGTCAGLSAVLMVISGGGVACAEPQQTQGARILANPSSFEREVLADKKVTKEEMQKALAKYSQCVSKTGATLTDLHGRRLAMSNLLVNLGEDTSAYDAIEKKVQSCRAEVDAVDAVWAMQSAPTAEERRHIATDLVTCLRHDGIDVPVGAGQDEAMRLYRQSLEAAGAGDHHIGSECVSEYYEAVGSPTPDGLADALASLK